MFHLTITCILIIAPNEKEIEEKNDFINKVNEPTKQTSKWTYERKNEDTLAMETISIKGLLQYNNGHYLSYTVYIH